MFSAGPHSHYCHGAVHQTGTDVSSRVILSQSLQLRPSTQGCKVSAWFFAFAATAVPGLGSGRLADAPAPLRGVREGLCRVLPGPGPLLRLGRHRVFQILSHRQEVGGHARSHTRSHARAADKYLPFISPQCLLSSRSSCARRLGFCVNDVTGGRTWELSAHLQRAVAVGFKRLCSRASRSTGCVF